MTEIENTDRPSTGRAKDASLSREDGIRHLIAPILEKLNVLSLDGNDEERLIALDGKIEEAAALIDREFPITSCPRTIVEADSAVFAPREWSIVDVVVRVDNRERLARGLPPLGGAGHPVRRPGAAADVVASVAANVAANVVDVVRFPIPLAFFTPEEHAVLSSLLCVSEDALPYSGALGAVVLSELDEPRRLAQSSPVANLLKWNKDFYCRNDCVKTLRRFHVDALLAAVGVEWPDTPTFVRPSVAGAILLVKRFAAMRLKVNRLLDPDQTLELARTAFSIAASRADARLATTARVLENGFEKAFLTPSVLQRASLPSGRILASSYDDQGLEMYARDGLLRSLVEFCARICEDDVNDGVRADMTMCEQHQTMLNNALDFHRGFLANLPVDGLRLSQEAGDFNDALEIMQVLMGTPPHLSWNNFPYIPNHHHAKLGIVPTLSGEALTALSSFKATVCDRVRTEAEVLRDTIERLQEEGLRQKEEAKRKGRPYDRLVKTALERFGSEDDRERFADGSMPDDEITALISRLVWVGFSGGVLKRFRKIAKEELGAHADAPPTFTTNVVEKFPAPVWHARKAALAVLDTLGQAEINGVEDVRIQSAKVSVVEHTGTSATGQTMTRHAIRITMTVAGKEFSREFEASVAENTKADRTKTDQATGSKMR